MHQLLQVSIKFSLVGFSHHPDLICLDFSVSPYCSEMYVNLRMEPAYVSEQTILDSSGNSCNALNGIDASSSLDAAR